VDGGGEIIASIINGNTWAFTTSYMSDNGTFTLDGNYGLIHSKNYDADIGMFVLTSPTTITAYTRYPFMDEVYYSYATKQ
jgi:hypothetical protein